MPAAVAVSPATHAPPPRMPCPMPPLGTHAPAMHASPLPSQTLFAGGNKCFIIPDSEKKMLTESTLCHCKPILERLLCFQSSIASIIAGLTLTFSVNGPLQHCRRIELYDLVLLHGADDRKKNGCAYLSHRCKNTIRFLHFPVFEK